MIFLKAALLSSLIFVYVKEVIILRRYRPRPSTDRKYFRTTANRTKALNLFNFRGGTRL